MTTPLTLVSQASTPDNANSYPPGSREAQLVSFVTTKYQQIKNSRSYIERQWYINLAYNFGKQNSAPLNTNLSNSGFKLHTPKAPPWRVRLVVNRIRPIVRKQIASLFANKPRFEVVPATTEDEDLIAARAGEQIFDWVYDAKNLQDVFKAAGWWASITGTGFVKTYWDAGKTDPSGVKGDFCVESVTPFHIFVPDFRAENIEDEPYVIHASTRTPEWVENTYGSKVNPTTTAANSILDDAFLNMIGTTSNASKECLVLECWIKPKTTKVLPSGGVITVVSGQLAQVVEGFPYDNMLYPFAKLVNIPSGKFYGEAMITDLLPIQKEYNRSRSQIVEAKNMMAKPKLLAFQGSVDPNKITTEPGQAILVKPGYPMPTPLNMPELPGYVMQHLEQLENDFNVLSGNLLTNGQTPPSGTSATALSFQQEQNDTMLQDTTDSLEAAVQKIGRCILALAGQYWTQPRLVKVIGTDGAFDAQQLKGDDLKGNYDLRVEQGSALPKSKAAKQAFITNLMQMGAIPMQEGLEMMDLQDIEKILDDVLADKRQAQRENVKIAEGVPLQAALDGGPGTYLANEWDNHELHIQVHNRYRKSQTFEQLPVEQQVVFQNHVKAHQAAAILQANGDPTGSGEPDTGLPSTQPPPMEQPEQVSVDPTRMTPTAGAEGGI